MPEGKLDFVSSGQKKKKKWKWRFEGKIVGTLCTEKTRGRTQGSWEKRVGVSLGNWEFLSCLVCTKTTAMVNLMHELD